MRLLLWFVVCVVFAENLSAMQSVTAFVVRAATRRRAPLGVLANQAVQRFKADITIAFEESIGPRDPFLSHLDPSTEKSDFEEMVKARRVELGLAPFVQKR